MGSYSLFETFAQTAERGQFRGARRTETGVYLTTHEWYRFTRHTHEWSAEHAANEPAQLLAKLLAVGFQTPRNEEIITCRGLC